MLLRIKMDGFFTLNCCNTSVKYREQKILSNSKCQNIFKKYVSFRRTRGAKIDSNTISEHQQTMLFYR